MPGMEATVSDPSRRSMIRALAWALFGLAVLEMATAIILTGVKLSAGSVGDADAIASLTFLPAGAAFSTVGLMVALRRSDNPAGWLILVTGAPEPGDRSGSTF